MREVLAKWLVKKAERGPVVLSPSAAALLAALLTEHV
jgi:hypothetical protein